MQTKRPQATNAVIAVLLAISLAAVSGCGRATDGPVAEGAGSEYLIPVEPAGAVGVSEAHQNAKNQQAVVVVGRIGGDKSPWVDGVAAFSIVDPSLVPCNERDDDACPTPWDYCCDLDLLSKSKALVKIVDPQEQLVKVDMRKLLPVKELQTVVVQGKASRDEAGNLTVLATGIHIRP